MIGANAEVLLPEPMWWVSLAWASLRDCRPPSRTSRTRPVQHGDAGASCRASRRDAAVRPSCPPASAGLPSLRLPAGSLSSVLRIWPYARRSAGAPYRAFRVASWSCNGSAHTSGCFGMSAPVRSSSDTLGEISGPVAALLFLVQEPGGYALHSPSLSSWGQGADANSAARRPCSDVEGVRPSQH